VSLRSKRRDQRGSAAVEFLIGVPVMLMLGLGGLQAGQWFAARLAVRLAAEEAVAFGAANNADIGAIERGFSRAMVPYLYGASDHSDFIIGVAKSEANTALGQAQGWIKMKQLAPTQASFDDWAVPAVDAATGQEIQGVSEIPNDNLHFYKTTMQPKTGSSGQRGEEPIGVASGQTLLDANQLKVEFVYGFALTLPIVGKLTSSFLLAVNNCTTPTQQSFGLLTIQNTVENPVSNSQLCDYLNLQPARLPVKVQSIAAMQTPARKSQLTQAKSHAADAAGTWLPPGAVQDYPKLAAIAQLNPAGAGIGSAVQNRATGYLSIGAPRTAPKPGQFDGGFCPAP
jgi:hypothetical protein